MRPSVAIITPSFNQAQFIAQTIESVLAQRYEPLDYCVRDAGSTDGTLEILERYRNRIRVVVEPDGGQADAINRGLRETQADIVAWLNSDDFYVPGSMAALVDHLARHPDQAMVYGTGQFTDAGGELAGPYPTAPPTYLRSGCVVCQPAAFMQRAAVEAVGFLDARLRFCMDYDLWLRLAERYPIAHVPIDVARYRLHPGAKSVSERLAFMREVVQMTRTRLGRAPLFYVYAYANLLIEQRIAAGRRLPTLLRRSAAFALGAALAWRYHGIPHPIAVSEARRFERGPWPDPLRLGSAASPHE